MAVATDLLDFATDGTDDYWAGLSPYVAAVAAGSAGCWRACGETDL